MLPIAHVGVSQESDEATLASAEAAFDFSFGLRRWGDEMSDAQSPQSALELALGIGVVVAGAGSEKTQAISVNGLGDLQVAKSALPGHHFEVFFHCEFGNSVGRERAGWMVFPDWQAIGFAIDGPEGGKENKVPQPGLARFLQHREEQLDLVKKICRQPVCLPLGPCAAFRVQETRLGRIFSMPGAEGACRADLQ